MPIFAVLQAGKARFGGQPIWWGNKDNPQPFTINNLAAPGMGNIWIGNNMSVGPSNPNESTIVTPGGYLSFDGTEETYYVIADAANIQAIVYPGVISVFQSTPPATTTTGSLTEDGSAPATATLQQTSGVFSIATNSFSPPAPSLLVAIVQMANTTGVIQISDSANHTWTQKAVVDGVTQHVAIFETAITAAGSLTVTAASSVNTDQPVMQLTVKVIKGANTNQSTAASNTNTGSNQDATGSITTTQVGSFVYVSLIGNTAQTADANTSLINEFDPSAIGAGLTSAKQTVATTVAGATSLGAHWSSGVFGWDWCAVEIIHT